MLMSVLLAAGQPIVETPVETGSPRIEAENPCSYDLESMLKLDWRAFDQDMNGGWRLLSRRDECKLAAAELIREWRHEKRSHNHILYWHEGQLRAFAGRNQEAIALFRLTYKDVNDDAQFGWNHYVSGSIAFLSNDRESLRNAMDRLKDVPPPADKSMKRPDGTVSEIRWPPNLNVLEAFERCWGKSYSEAYGSDECAEPDPK